MLFRSTEIGAKRAALPIRYLGLPLSAKKLRNIDFQQLLQSVQARMESWQSSFLTYGGRMVLIRSVLTALPLHYMQAIKLSKGVINYIDRARRRFLWKGNGTCKGINCLVSWDVVCAMRRNGGMGLLDLETQNDALLTKWLWKLDKDKEGLWAKTMSLLYGINGASQALQDPILSSFVHSLNPQIGRAHV